MSSQEAAALRSRVWTILALGGVGAAVFLLILRLGSLLLPPGGAQLTLPGKTDEDGSTGQFIIAFLTILVMARLVGGLGRRLGQPAVVGEIVAGLVLGPSVLGRLAPGVMKLLLPAAVMPGLSVFARIGVMLFMFLVGLELDVGELRRQGASTLAISLGSIVVPFVSGAGLALLLYEGWAGKGTPFPVFALFLGVSMSVTALPVLARILGDQGIQATMLGVRALACAAVNDLTAWCLLALSVSVAEAHAGGAVITVVLAIGWVAVVLLALGPAVRRLVSLQGLAQPLSRGSLGVVFAGLLLSALVTETIGIHAIFGAFLFGVIVPHDSQVARDLRRQLEDLVVVLFLPAYFAFTGLRTEVGLVSDAMAWSTCGLVLLVASVAKFAGTALTARSCGHTWRHASALGVLMNARGLMELVVLNIGLDLGVISRPLFAIMVLMAVTTTLMTTPLLRLLHNGEEPEPAPALAENLKG